MTDFTVKPIKARVAMEHYETKVEICGVETPVIVGYNPVKGYPATQDEPGVDDYVEILSVMLEIKQDLIEIETSQEWDEEIAAEIQGKLDA